MRPSTSSSPAAAASSRRYAFTSSSETSIPALLGERLERELAGDRDGRLEHHLSLQVLGAPAARGEVGLERDAAALERAHEPGEEIGGARADERKRRLHLGRADELVHRGHPERRVDLRVELLAERPLDARARAPRACRTRSPRGPARRRAAGRYFSCTSRTVDLDCRGRPVGARECDLLRLAGRRADEHRLELGRETAAARARRPCRAAPRRRDRRGRRRACRPSCAGRLVRGRELGDRLAERLDLGVDVLLRHLDLGARHLERRPVDDLGQRLHLDGRRERSTTRPRCRGARTRTAGSAIGRTRLREAALQNQPPMWLSTASA